MSCTFRPVILLRWALCIAVVLAAAGGCGPEHYKADADQEVYKIIDSKWHSSFGQKANYTISDIPPSPNDVQIEKNVPSANVITLAHAIATATANNRNYLTQKENLYLVALDLTLTRYQYTRQWFGTIDSEYLMEADKEDLSLAAGGGVDHMQLLADGVMFGTALAVDWVRFISGDPRTTLGSVLSASLAVPLLGVGSGKILQEDLTQAEREVLYRIRSFNRYRKSFVVSIISDYYDVLQRRDKVINDENNYKSKVESKRRLEMEAEAGRRRAIDVDEAGQDVLRAEVSYVAAQQNYEQQLDRFKIRLSLPTDADVILDQNELKALEEIGISEPGYTLDEAIEMALLGRLDLANSMDRIDDALRKAILAVDGLGPELNLIGNINVDSKEKTDLGRLQFHEGRYGLGLEADLPFDRKAQRNAYRESLIAMERQRREYENDVDEIKFQVRQAYRELKEKAESYRIQKDSLDLARRRVENNELLLDAGRGTVRILLVSQDALVRAQNDVTAALVDHLDAKLSFYRDVGILQVRPDGMWQITAQKQESKNES